MKKRKKDNYTRRKSKKAQEAVGMSFSTIFSIILMIFFVVAAFIAIRFFYNMTNCSKLSSFILDFKSEIKKAWYGSSNKYTFSANVPSGIKYVCFADASKDLKGKDKDKLDEDYLDEGIDGNMFIYPKGKNCDFPVAKIDYLNMAELIKTENPYCIPVTNGKISIKIEKGLNDNLIKISR